ncbi:hypothetical protein IFM89_009684, partial [Coptis chinensis]
ELLGRDPKICPDEGNVETDLTTHPQLAQQLKFMVRDVLNLQTDKWVPSRKETITEIHSDAEKTLGLRPGATVSIRVNRGTGVDAIGGLSPGGFPNRPGAGGIMPGMPGARKMPRMPGIDNIDNWEGCGGVIIGRTSLLLQGSGAGSPGRPSNTATTIDPVAYSPPTKHVTSVAPVLPAEKRPAPVAKINPDELRKKTVSLLKEYFGICILYEAIQCVEELKARAECYGIPPGCCKLKEAFLVGLDMSPHMLNEIGIDLPKAPSNFGEIMAKLVLSGCLDFKVVKEVLKKVEDDFIQNDIFDGTIECISADPSGQVVLEAQAEEI